MRPSRMPRPRHATHKAQTMICQSHDSGGLTTGAGGQFAMIGSTVLLRSSIRAARAPHRPAAAEQPGPAVRRSRGPQRADRLLDRGQIGPAGAAGRRLRGRRQDTGVIASRSSGDGTLIPSTRARTPHPAHPPGGRAGPSTARRPTGVRGPSQSMLSVHISSPTCAQRSRGRPRATSAMNSRRWSAAGLMPPMLPAARTSGYRPEHARNEYR